MPQKPPEGNYSQTNVFAIHEFSHLYLCRCRWLCERTKVCLWINTFASEFNTFLSRIKLFLLNFLSKECWKNAPLAGFVCVFLQSCNRIIFTFTGKCLIILMFYASIFDGHIFYFERIFRSKSFIPERNVLNSEANVLIQKQTFVLSHSHLHLHKYKCANSWIPKTLVWE